MSKKNNPAVEAEAPVATQKTVVTEKKTACRLFSFLFLVASAVALLAIPYGVVSLTEATPLYQVIMTMFGSEGFMLAAADGIMNTIYNVAIYVFALFLAIAALLSLVGIFTGSRKTLKAVLFFFTVGAVVYTACYVVVAGTVDLLSLIVAGVAIFATIICVIATKPKVEVIEEEVEEEDDGFEVEEYAEAYPYEGGPVAGVVMAEEVNPSFLPHEPHVNTAGYDFYNSKSFDAFIAMLNEEERNQFTELFILRFQGTMPELPEYQVGGDNKEFFRKVFIYLGQYRDRIPSGLLGKMYQFSLKLN